jgi:hypothetical protein
LPPCDDDDDVLDEHNRRRHTSLPPTASGEESAMSRECHEYVPGLIAGGTRMKRKGAEGWVPVRRRWYGGLFLLENI